MSRSAQTAGQAGGWLDCKPSSRFVHFQALFVCFIAFSCAGWVYETLNEILILHIGFNPRAYLVGPWCPVYGIGGILVVLFFRGLLTHRIEVGPQRDGRRRANLSPLVAAVAICALCTAVELACSYVLSSATGTFPWSYADAWGNFDGHIAPEYSLRFTVGGMLVLYVVYPAICKGIGRARPAVRNAVFWGLLIAFALDVALEFTGVWTALLR